MKYQKVLLCPECNNELYEFGIDKKRGLLLMCLQCKHVCTVNDCNYKDE